MANTDEIKFNLSVASTKYTCVQFCGFVSDMSDRGGYNSYNRGGYNQGGGNRGGYNYQNRRGGGGGGYQNNAPGR